MADYYLGEIRMFTCSYAPQTWHLCDGTMLNIQQNAALYALIGTQFGGDGQTTFALPDLRGRTIAGILPSSPSFQKVGTKGGIEGEVLTLAETPPHTHVFGVSNTAGNTTFAGKILAEPVGPSGTQVNIYNTNASAQTTLNTATIGSAGGGAAHNNMQPFTTINYCIAIQGDFPQRN